MLKFKFLLYLILFTTSCSLKAQWQEQLDIEYFAYFKHIHFLDENYGWAMATGPYFYTTNGGENWYIDPNWWDNVGHDIVFVDQYTGFMAANDGIIKKTIDGGVTWIDIVTPTTNDIHRLFFIDENIGWALGNSDGKALHTTDGGESWGLQQVLHEEIGSLLSIFFINEYTGWAGGYGISNGDNFSEITKTINEGIDWSTQYLEDFHFAYYDLFFINLLNGWVVGETGSGYPIIKFTTNGGETWEYPDLPELVAYGTGNTVSIGAIYSIQFINETDGWLTCTSVNGIGGYILITTDAGETWQQQYASAGSIRDICIINENHAWATGGDFIHFNSDIYYIPIIPIGVGESIMDESISLYPNPVSQKLFINNSEALNIRSIRIYDVLGKLVLHEHHNFEQIYVSSLKSGVYLVKIETEMGIVIKKVVKK